MSESVSQEIDGLNLCKEEEENKDKEVEVESNRDHFKEKEETTPFSSSMNDLVKAVFHLKSENESLKEMIKTLKGTKSKQKRQGKEVEVTSSTIVLNSKIMKELIKLIL